MIIDVHGHVNAPDSLYSYKTRLQASNGLHKRRPGQTIVKDDDLRRSTEEHLALLDGVGTDVQFISPRPYQLMHSESPFAVVADWIGLNNDVIAAACRQAPDRLRGVAGLPQSSSAGLEAAAAELERCVLEYGFVGCLLNPDPDEGRGMPPTLGERYWYPLYEKMCELDVPALIHSASCRNPRETYSAHFITEESIAILSLLRSPVFTDFPDLKIVVAHGGGSVPYQIGRWRALRVRQGGRVTDFDEQLRRMWFDSVLYNTESIEFLIRMVGADRVLFGTELPGSGTATDPETGRSMDDLKPLIDAFDWLNDEDRHAVFEGNARRCYTRLDGKPR
jgi:4-oxalmesaconate hydratase